MERRLQDGDIDHQHVREERQRHRADEPSVLEKSGEGAAPSGAAIKDVDELEHHQRRKRHCARMSFIGRIRARAARQQREQPAGIIGIKHGKGAHHHHDSNAGKAQPVVRIKHAGVASSRLLVHDVGVFGVDAERERRRPVGHEVDPEELGGEQRQEQPGLHGHEAEQTRKHHASEHRQQLAGIRRQEIDQVLADVVVNPATFLDGLDDTCEIIIRQHHVGRLLRDVGAGDAHGDADICGLERGSIVDAVAGHGDDVTLALQRLDDA
jgi:hypothetical protein